MVEMAVEGQWNHGRNKGCCYVGRMGAARGGEGCLDGSVGRIFFNTAKVFVEHRTGVVECFYMLL